MIKHQLGVNTILNTRFEDGQNAIVTAIADGYIHITTDDGTPYVHTREELDLLFEIAWEDDPFGTEIQERTAAFRKHATFNN